MSVNVGDLLTIENEKYITIEVLNYENKNYAFVNKSINEDITNDFYIFEIFEDNSVRVVYEENLKDALIPKFEEKLKENIKGLNKDENNN